MQIDGIESNKLYLPQNQQNIDLSTQSKGNDKFVDSLSELIHDTNSMQKDSANLTEKMIKGEPVDLHDVMISAEKAKTSFQLLMEIRNKFLDMYKEVSRMQT